MIDNFLNRKISFSLAIPKTVSVEQPREKKGIEI